MRSALRSLTLGLVGLLGTGAMAQYPYWLTVTGSVSNCYPGQVINLQTVGGTQPSYAFDIPVDQNTCSYLATVGISSTFATWVMTTQCNGQVISYADSAVFNFMGDSAYAVMTFDCGNSNIFDCAGVVNGPAMPGTPCDDGDPGTFNDIYQVDCSCSGQDSIGSWDCLQIWNGPNMPGSMCVNFLGDTGIWSVQCQCQTNSNIYDCTGALNGPNMPGTPCVWNNQPGVWGPDCVCNVDSNGTWYDCLGILNGPNMPGTTCDDGDPLTVQDHWNANCVCEGFANGQIDCLGVMNGWALPGTACTYTLDSITYITSIWTPDCVCGPDSNFFQYDCLGVLNGNALPGTSCTIPGTIIEGTWSANCVCEDNTPTPCNADFWVMQAWGQDSLPVPSELWIWNLSSGGSGSYTYLWNFGDGTSSTDAYPTHTYQDNGPYTLCLTIDDGAGCVDTYCDSISVDDNGMLNGMIGEGNRTNGFTINVQNQNANAIEEVMSTEGLAIWPNPVQDELNIALVGRMSGTIEVTITDLNGRIVKNERSTLTNGKNQLHLSTSDLGAGMYMVRIANNDRTLTQRFVKAN